MLAERALETPQAAAFVDDAGTAWTEIRWDEFERRVNALARALVGLGLAPGEHVGILAPSCLGWELFHHAILCAGGVVVGLEPHDTAERLQWIADHAELRVLIVQDRALMEKLSLDRIARYRFVVVLSDAEQTSPGSNIRSWAELERAATTAGKLPEVLPDWPATLIYTSGTTGQPKGILYRHDQVALAVQAIARAYPSLVGARFVCWLPLSNLFQRIMNLVAIRFGGTVYIVRNPVAVLKALPVAQPDVFIGVPRFYEKLHEGIVQEVARKPAMLRGLIRASIDLGDRVASARREGRAAAAPVRLLHQVADAVVLRKLRQVMGGRARFMVTGSAPTPVRLLEFFDAIGLPLYEAYGMSENIVPMALNRPEDFRLGTVGKALPENLVRCDEDGELLVKGPGVFAGYYKDEQRDERFTSDGFYRTGDYAEVMEGGYLRIKGRKSEIIKTSSGRRISPVGVEAAIQELSYVDRAVVIGSGRKCLVALVTLQAEGSGSASGAATPDLRDPKPALPRDRVVADLAAAVGKLPPAERPAGYWLLQDAFSVERGELTPNLKLRRAQVEARYSHEIEDLYAQVDARTADGTGRTVIVGLD